ncbi:rho GTPase-activating protein 26-like isoform X2 [Symsagittifera roscoffensis]|uniref:rho GTPase-activating protein 26-like isoform X2 n=1 Tax=Symsagittifera roscoffensis TaxID=84072 RepID=UPI00307BDF30
MAVDTPDGVWSNRLEFTECILDSPHFRSTLRGKYSTFEDISSHFKTVIKNALILKEQQKKTLAAYKVLLDSIREHPVPHGENMTRDEEVAYNAVHEFVDMMKMQEEKCQTVQEAGLDALVAGLQHYQRNHADTVKEDYKKFKKATEKYCHSQEKYLSISTKKKSQNNQQDSTPISISSGMGSFEEMDRTMMQDTATFHSVSTDVVWNVLEGEEQTRLNFIQHIYEFTRTYLASFIWGYLENVKRFQGYYPFLEDVIASSQKQLQLTAEEAKALRANILKDPQLAIEQKKTLYDKQGYLWVYDTNKKKMLVSTAHSNLASSKYFCQYRNKERQLAMTQYHQVNPPKNLNVEFFKVKQCCRRATSESERQFLFDLTVENSDKVLVQLTMQAQSNEDRAQWLNVMEGEEPIYEDYRKFQSMGMYELDARGLEFIDFIVVAIEKEGGLETEGPFRRPGGAKRVSELLEAFFIYRDVGSIMQDPNGVEVKTLTSALKRFLTELKEPLIPYHLYYKLINVAKTCDSKEQQINHVHSIIHQMPKNHFQAFKKLNQHFGKIIAASEKTKMNAANLSTCVGTSLLHSEGKSIANVMEIKFVNQIVLLILNNYQQIFETTPEPFGSATKQPSARVSRSVLPATATESRGGAIKDANPRSASAESLVDGAAEEYSTFTIGRAGLFNRSAASRSSLKSHKSAPRPSSLNTSSGSRIKNSPSAHQIQTTSPSSPNENHLSANNFTYSPIQNRPHDGGDIHKMNPFGPKNTCVRTLYDCTGDPNREELSFNANQIIVNVVLTDEPGWLKGTLNGKDGLFPANYCQVVDPLECLKLSPEH